MADAVNKVTVAAKINATNMVRLDKHCESMKRTRSQLIDFAIDDWLAKQDRLQNRQRKARAG